MRAIKSSLLLLIITAATSCDLFKNDHELRIRNNYRYTVYTSVGGVEYSPVAYGTTSGYKSIGEGTHTLAGNLNGTVHFYGNGYHKWTLTVQSDGTFSLEED